MGTEKRPESIGNVDLRPVTPGPIYSITPKNKGPAYGMGLKLKYEPSKNKKENPGPAEYKLQN